MKKEMIKDIFNITTIVFGILSIIFVCLSVAGVFAYSTSFVIVLGFLTIISFEQFILKRGLDEEKIYLYISIMIAVIFVISLIIKLV